IRTPSGNLGLAVALVDRSADNIWCRIFLKRFGVEMTGTLTRVPRRRTGGRAHVSHEASRSRARVPCKCVDCPPVLWTQREMVRFGQVGPQRVLYRSFGVPSEGRRPPAWAGVTACLSSAVQRYPSCSRVANITIGTIVCDNVAPCALESAAKQAAPRTMIGGRTTNLNRIPSIHPISVLQIASVITQPYSTNELETVTGAA